MIKAIYDLDMTPRRSLPIIVNVSQNDDLGRTLVFNLFSSTGTWTAPDSATATLEGGKPDGKFFSFNCTYSKGTVTAIIQQQMTAVSGKVVCKVKVQSGNKVIESAPIYMMVDAAGIPDGADMSKSDVNDAVAAATKKIVEQVAGSIPEDYSALNQSVDELKQDIGNIKSDVSNVKSDKISKPTSADNGKLARAKDGAVEWVDVGQPTDQQTKNAVTNWLDNHPEATTTVQDGAIGEQKISTDFLPWIKKDYVTPEMFGAKCDGITDDSEAIQKALDSNKNVFFTSGGKYKCNKTIDITDKTIYAVNAELDFSDFYGENCVVSNGNSTKIFGINILNGTNITGYGLKLLYIANKGIVQNVQIINCINGMYISGAWYNHFSNVFIRCTSGICLTIGNEKYVNSANGILFANLFLHGGTYGLVFDNVTVNSLEFIGITIENQTKCGIYSKESRGNISLSGVYFEGCALDSEYPLIDAEELCISISNVLIRGKYTACINAYKCNNIIGIGAVFNPSNIPYNVKYSLQYNPILINSYSPLMTLSNNKVTGARMIKGAEESALKFKIVLEAISDIAIEITSFGQLPSDSTAAFVDSIIIFVKNEGNVKKAYLKANHAGERDLSSSYSVDTEISYNNNFNCIVEINLSNSNGFFKQYQTTNNIDVLTRKNRIIEIQQIS